MPDMSLDCIFARRSIRKYTEEPVGEEDLNLLLRAAMSAPSAVNTRPWELVVAKSPQVLQDLSAICPYWGPVGRAPLGIVVCGHVTGQNRVEAFTVQDCSAATENILLAATALGLGAVWLGCYGVPDRVDAVSRLLGLPQDGSILPISVIAVGHPAESRPAHGQPDPERIHYDAF